VLLYEKFEETKGVIRSCKSKKDRQYNCQKKKDKKANEWSAKHYTEFEKTKDWATWTEQKKTVLIYLGVFIIGLNTFFRSLLMYNLDQFTHKQIKVKKKI